MNIDSKPRRNDGVLNCQSQLVFLNSCKGTWYLYARLVFSIRKAIDDNTKVEGHHSDLYVFCHYKASRKEQNILDMGLWDFYVYPTFKIDNDPKLKDKNSISIYRIKKLGVAPVSFDVLYDEIMCQISVVSEHLSKG